MVFSEIEWKRKADVTFPFWFLCRCSFFWTEIKRDENMTVFMVKKYLVRKLALSNEAEVIYCSLPLSRFSRLSSLSIFNSSVIIKGPHA